MPWFADLSPCTYFGEECATFLRSVGWLERGRPFATASVNSEVFMRLLEMVKDPWQPSIFTGVHCCDLCLYEGNGAGVKNSDFSPSRAGRSTTARRTEFWRRTGGAASSLTGGQARSWRTD